MMSMNQTVESGAEAMGLAEALNTIKRFFSPPLDE